MQKIKTIIVNSSELVSVNIDGWCNHAATHEETEEFDEINIDGADRSYTETLEVCDRCSAYRLAYITEASEWQGVQQLPIIYGEF